MTYREVARKLTLLGCRERERHRPGARDCTPRRGTRPLTAGLRLPVSRCARCVVRAGEGAAGRAGLSLAGMAALRSGERVAATLGVVGAVVACACSGFDRHAGQRRQGHPGRGERVADALFKVVLTGWATFVGCGGAREVVVQSSYWLEPQHNGDYMATGAYGGELMAFAGSWEPAQPHGSDTCVRPSLSVGAPRDDFASFYPNIVGLRLQCYGP